MFVQTVNNNNVKKQLLLIKRGLNKNELKFEINKMNMNMNQKYDFEYFEYIKKCCEMGNKKMNKKNVMKCGMK